MEVIRNKPCGGINLKPCQACNILKDRFYLCDKGHSTCFDCHNLRREHFCELAQRVACIRSPSPIADRLSPSSAFSYSGSSPTRPRGSPSNVAFRSPSGSPAEVLDHEDSHLKTSQMFCKACGSYRDAVPVTLPRNILAMVPRSSNQVEAEEDPAGDDEDQAKVHGNPAEVYEDPAEVREYYEAEDDVDFPELLFQSDDEEELRREVDVLRDQLVVACSEILDTRKTISEVAPRTDKLGMDVDMLRGGVNYLFFNFDVLQSGREIWTEERICGIPFVIMVRLRNLSRTPYLGFFIGLTQAEGLAHSPLRKHIVFRAHNAYGKVIETLNLDTFENGECVHQSFDRTKRSSDNSLYGYATFLKKSRILKPDMLEERRLCLSLQVKMLSTKNFHGHLQPC